MGEMKQGVFADAYTPDQAVQLGTASINRAIERTVEGNPELKKEYLRRLGLQEKIDAYKEAGKPLPRDWILNTFYREYYQDTGMLAEK